MFWRNIPSGFYYGRVECDFYAIFNPYEIASSPEEQPNATRWVLKKYKPPKVKADAVKNHPNSAPLPLEGVAPTAARGIPSTYRIKFRPKLNLRKKKPTAKQHADVDSGGNSLKSRRRRRRAARSSGSERANGVSAVNGSIR